MPTHPNPDTPEPPKTAQELVDELVHDLGNSLEIIVQTSYLLGTLDLGENGKAWHKMLDDGVTKATAINRLLREALKGESNLDTSGS